MGSKHISTTYDPPAAAKPRPPRLGQRPKPSTVPNFALRAAGAMVVTPPRRVLREQAPRVSKPAWNDGHDGGAFNKKMAKAQAAMPNVSNLKKQLNPGGTVASVAHYSGAKQAGGAAANAAPKKQQQQQQQPQQQQQQQQRQLSSGKKKTSPKKGQGPRALTPSKKLNGGAKKDSNQPSQQQKGAAAAAAKVGHQHSAA